MYNVYDYCWGEDPSNNGWYEYLQEYYAEGNVQKFHDDVEISGQIADITNSPGIQIVENPHAYYGK